MGISRSATVVCAYLIATRGMTPRDALEHVIARRDVVWPNAGFQRQLDIYATRLRGEHPRAPTRKLRKILPAHLAPPPSPSMSMAMSVAPARSARPHPHQYLPSELPPIARRGSMG